MTALVACSHGTHDLAGRAAIAALLDDVRDLRPELEVLAAYVDVQEPYVGDVAAAAAADGGTAVVVPALLSTGFHVKQDIGRAQEPDGVVAAPPMGPHPLLVAVLVDRLLAVGIGDEDAVVVAAAGSSDPEAATAVVAITDAVRAALAARGVRPVSVAAGYGAGARPRLAEALAQARALGSARVVAASYLLAPGFFYDRVVEAGFDVVTPPLTPDVRLAQVLLERFDAARTRLAEPTPAGR